MVQYNILSAKDPIKIYALVRDIEKAKRIFDDSVLEQIRLLESDICLLEPKNMNVEYIIHGAGQTSSKAFVDEPVETIMTAIKGTQNLLEFTRLNPVRGFVYLSTMEIYGYPDTDEKIFENHSCNLDSMNIRSCYPKSKRMCENLCASYAHEYNLPIKVARLTQTFGPGVDYSDSRVFAEFARCAIEGRNIILNTKGETKRCYLYVDDAVNAIFTILYKGKNGKAYNVANENTYCSIYEMAKMVAEKCANPPVTVVINDTENISQFGYAPTLKMNLATDEVRSLGWKAETGLLESFKNMIGDMKKENI